MQPQTPEYLKAPSAAFDRLSKEAQGTLTQGFWKSRARHELRDPDCLFQEVCGMGSLFVIQELLDMGVSPALVRAAPFDVSDDTQRAARNGYEYSRARRAFLTPSARS